MAAARRSNGTPLTHVGPKYTSGRRLMHTGYEQIWEIVSRIPRGRVSTYGQIAKLAGLVRRARFVGYALHNLPSGMPIPWHRVINAKGMISFPPGSASYQRQRELLEREGVRFVDGKVDLKKKGWGDKKKSDDRGQRPDRRGQSRETGQHRPAGSRRYPR
jgi:methylated-DNA-protein-cysteine methyltransferase-like protein